MKFIRIINKYGIDLVFASVGAVNGFDSQSYRCFEFITRLKICKQFAHNEDYRKYERELF